MNLSDAAAVRNKNPSFTPGSRASHIKVVVHSNSNESAIDLYNFCWLAVVHTSSFHTSQKQKTHVENHLSVFLGLQRYDKKDMILSPDMKND